MLNLMACYNIGFFFIEYTYIVMTQHHGFRFASGTRLLEDKKNNTQNNCYN